MTPLKELIFEKPIRVQRKRTNGWKMPDNTVYVGRPGKWGNPFKVGMDGIGTNQNAVDAYKNWINHDISGIVTKIYAERDLKGHNLACFCALDQPCHADVLLEIANQ